MHKFIYKNEQIFLNIYANENIFMQIKNILCYLIINILSYSFVQVNVIEDYFC